MILPSDAPSATLDAPREPYRGRLAPSPTGYLHLGHAQTFWTAQTRARSQGGSLILRIEDLDLGRSKPEFTAAAIADLRWFGFQWQEGPDCGGPFSPYVQTERIAMYEDAFNNLKILGLIYPCQCSRKDIQHSLQAPHADDDEPIYPGTCRPDHESRITKYNHAVTSQVTRHSSLATRHSNWRFRVPDGEAISFVDGHFGLQQFVAGKDFGDFVVWRHDQLPAYQLAVVVDDAAMRITEVVRGADLLKSTARQVLLYRALGLTPPRFYHCPLVTDDAGQRLAKRHDALSLHTLRQRGQTSESLRENWKL